MIRMEDAEVSRDEGPIGTLGPAQIPEFSDIITDDPQFKEILAWLPLYADSDLPVLLTGEPGTGKELVARALAALGPDWRQPCLHLNCAALTESLASSELFGHVQGAYTDARHNRPGKFRLAHRGTLFLDEVGELPLSIQAKLLRTVEQGEIEPVGGDLPVSVDVRLIAATNQDLAELMAQGRFRRDLYDRLAVLALHLPPLRERPGDIAVLAEQFVQGAARRYGRSPFPGCTARARRRLEQHDWPGNVRELKNVLTRAVLLCSGSRIRESDLWFDANLARLREDRPAAGKEMPGARPSARRLRELLDSEGGNVAALSRRLQVCSKTIYRWVRSHHIDLMQIRAAPGG